MLPVSLVEDTAVDPRVLSQYIAEFKEIMAAHGLNCVYHAHIATGELHLRPVINLKDPEGCFIPYDCHQNRSSGQEIQGIAKW